MAVEQNLQTISLIAGADLTTAEGYGMVLSVTNADEIVRAHTTNLNTPLVLGNDPASGQAAMIVIGGIAKVVSKGDGTAIVKGDRLGPNQSGLWIKITTDGWNYGGIALAASQSDGFVIPMLVTPGVMRGA